MIADPDPLSSRSFGNYGFEKKETTFEQKARSGERKEERKKEKASEKWILQGINKRVNVFPLRSANDLFSRVWQDGGGREGGEEEAMEIQDSRVAGNESSMGRSNR